ncbi:MAG: FMN-binding protein [Deltaproteobacteria bacterium]|nr:FMN-binding protein [Deltaproteobacteria bacterium]
MYRISSHLLWIVMTATIYLSCFLPSRAHAVQYMGLKEAIKYFLPQGSKVSKVDKTIPKDKLKVIEERFRLRSTDDFKETLPAGPYTFYIGRDASGKASIYIVILEQYWRTCYHKYAIGIEPSGKIKEVIVVELNCRFAYPINRKSFLKQFAKKSAAPGKRVPVEVGHDVDAISGASVSSEVTAIVTRRALALYELFFASAS